MTLRIEVWTFGWLIFPFIKMGKNGQGVHFSPFSTNRAVFLKFVSGDVFAHLIYFHHLLARLDSELSIVCMITPVLMPPIQRPLPSLLHKAPAAAAIMSCPLFCRLFLRPFPCLSTHCSFCLRLLWPSSSMLQLPTYLSKAAWVLPFLQGKLGTPRHPHALLNSLRDWANHTASTGRVLTLSLVTSRESHSTLYP